MNSDNLVDYFNAVCEFRQLNPVMKNMPLRTNDPAMIPIRDVMNGFKKHVQQQYQEINNVPFTVEVSRGIMNLPNVLYACILPPGQMVRNGIYTAICFDIMGRGALVGCVESKVTSKGLKTVQRKTGSALLFIDVDGTTKRTKYNNVFVNPEEFYYPLDDSEILNKHIHESMKLSLLLLDL
ncbi:hypothetical protein [Chryseobacterium takakiae]|uniref:Uncharacterized protein n=1 Tax=Chryseobacterium takakiae TaxID=1302685 RepID=A0A1M5A8W7_9FLAO|nr:hypothetical protein [Chryseobacterium takakiae]SHF26703.1 hypothetical protein SAMN05444408_11264 [Chryseobacterium takakiae]